MNSAARTVSATLWLNDPSDHRPAESPRPRLSKRSMPIPLSARALHIRDADGLSLPSVKPCENTPQPFTGAVGHVKDAGEQFAGGAFEGDFFGAGHGVPFRWWLALC